MPSYTSLRCHGLEIAADLLLQNWLAVDILFGSNPEMGEGKRDDASNGFSDGSQLVPGAH